MENKRTPDNNDDELVQRRYTRILKKSGIIVNEIEDTETVDEQVVIPDDLQIDVFFYSLQDKINAILKNKQLMMYLRCRFKKKYCENTNYIRQVRIFIKLLYARFVCI